MEEVAFYQPVCGSGLDSIAGIFHWLTVSVSGIQRSGSVWSLHINKDGFVLEDLFFCLFHLSSFLTHGIFFHKTKNLFLVARSFALTSKV